MTTITLTPLDSDELYVAVLTELDARGRRREVDHEDFDADLDAATAWAETQIRDYTAEHGPAGNYRIDLARIDWEDWDGDTWTVDEDTTCARAELDPTTDTITWQTTGHFDFTEYRR
ncbi:hypothetical protein [Nocardia terpenica]|uniref:Uncharacterized protein n=1 Tax=Nocardia terpenica TaxID=455432 RepID=A0A291RC64_9NOCA|nr:hypothetical protein [Nocardia terpenica]ATL65126.1 hypothetical protein CRH09_01670 [Nocardia terpenica]